MLGLFLIIFGSFLFLVLGAYVVEKGINNTIEWSDTDENRKTRHREV